MCIYLYPGLVFGNAGNLAVSNLCEIVHILALEQFEAYLGLVVREMAYVTQLSAISEGKGHFTQTKGDQLLMILHLDAQVKRRDHSGPHGAQSLGHHVSAFAQ